MEKLLRGISRILDTMELINLPANVEAFSVSVVEAVLI
jgi:hypothetical protein